MGEATIAQVQKEKAELEDKISDLISTFIYLHNLVLSDIRYEQVEVTHFGMARKEYLTRVKLQFNL
jgi:hypothetical protein